MKRRSFFAGLAAVVAAGLTNRTAHVCRSKRPWLFRCDICGQTDQRAYEVTLHGNEAVLTRSQVDRLVSIAASGKGRS